MFKRKQSLEQMGISAGYNSDSDTLNYFIQVNSDKLENPAESKRYFTGVIDAVSGDARKKGGLENLSIQIDDKYIPRLKKINEDLISQSKIQSGIREDPDFYPKPANIIMCTGMALGGIAGFISGYDPCSEFATYVSNNMNNTSHLLAPLTGLAEAGISILGTAAFTFAGMFCGGIIGGGTIFPYIKSKTPLAGKTKEYHSFLNALNNLEKGNSKD